jgi:hypothetical protein
MINKYVSVYNMIFLKMRVTAPGSIENNPDRLSIDRVLFSTRKTLREYSEVETRIVGRISWYIGWWWLWFQFGQHQDAQLIRRARQPFSPLAKSRRDRSGACMCVRRVEHRAGPRWPASPQAAPAACSIPHSSCLARCTTLRTDTPPRPKQAYMHGGSRNRRRACREGHLTEFVFF